MVTKKTDSESSRRLLTRLAAAYGVQTRYRDALGQVREPSQESLLKTLQALGAGVNVLGSRLLEPVTVAWEGELPGLVLRSPLGSRDARVRVR